MNDTEEAGKILTIEMWFTSARDGNVERLTEFVKTVNPSQKDPLSRTALMLASKYGRLDAVRYLLNILAQSTTRVDLHKQIYQSICHTIKYEKLVVLV